MHRISQRQCLLLHCLTVSPLHCSGFKTQSDSFRSDSTDKPGVQISDSDSAKSSGSTSTYPRGPAGKATKVGEGATFNSKYFLQMHGNKPNGHG